MLLCSFRVQAGHALVFCMHSSREARSFVPEASNLTRLCYIPIIMIPSFGSDSWFQSSILCACKFLRQYVVSVQ